MKKMKKLDILAVNICKMSESSGNDQFYVNLVRTDEKKHGSKLNYSCFQTKHFSHQECLERAWFTASMLARFCGLSSMDEIKLINFTDDEAIAIKKANYLHW